MQPFITSVESSTVELEAPRADVQGPPIGKRIRLAGAVLGAGLFVGMAALTIAFSGTAAQATSAGAGGLILGGAGDTKTQTTAPSTVSIPSASPTMKSSPWRGGWSGR
jgi:hypothetical protein